MRERLKDSHTLHVYPLSVIKMERIEVGSKSKPKKICREITTNIVTKVCFLSISLPKRSTLDIKRKKPKAKNSILH